MITKRRANANSVNQRKNITMLRHRFNTRSQKPTESYQSYFVDLTNKADSCEFGEARVHT